MVTCAVVVAAGCGAPTPTPTLEERLAVRFLAARLSSTDGWSQCETSGPESESSPYCAGHTGAGAFDPDVVAGLSVPSPTTRGPQTSNRDRHRLGLWNLAVADPSAADAAVALLDDLARDRDEAAVWNDLAVASLVRARLRDSPRDLVSALEAIERAARVAPAEPFVLFNRALLRQELHLLAAAELAWRRYLEVDPGSPWSAEARRRADELRSAIDHGEAADRREGAGRDDPQSRREHLQEELLAEWARAERRDSRRAGELLAAATERADALAADTGDPLLADVVTGIRVARERANGDLETLVAGHRAYAAAAELIVERRYDEARPHLEAAGRRLTEAQSPFASWVDFHLFHITTLQETRLDLGEELGQALLRRTERWPVSAVRGRTWWVMGTGRFLAGDLRGAAAAYSRSLVIFDALGEDRNARAVRSLSASVHDWLGEIDRAWALRADVLGELASGTDSRLRRLTALDAAFAARDLGLPGAAAVFQDEVVLIAEQVEDDPLPLANALLRRAEIVAERSPRAALADLARAERLAAGIADPHRRAVTMTQVLIERGTALRERSPERAVAALERALLSTGAEIDLFRPEIHASLGRAVENLGDIARSERELRTALDHLGLLRRSADNDVQRIHLAERADRVHDDLVRILLTDGRPAEAQAAAHAARSRTLIDRLQPNGGGRRPLAEGGRPVARPGEALVTFQVLADRVIAWVDRPQEAGMAVTAVPPGRLCAGVDEVVTALERGGEADAELTTLHELLIAPIAERLAGVDRLVLFPDDCLFRLPFAALRDPADGRYLVERFEMSLLPAAGLLGDGPPDGTDRPLRLLALADPAFDTELEPGLGRLPGARAEVAAVADHYRESTALTDAEATPAAFFARLPAHQVLHFAAHAVDGGRVPLEAAILLAAGDGDDGLLRARDLVGGDFAHLRLVVLAGCRTGGRAAVGGEGAVGLAWPFLAGGAEAVLATLWPVDDREMAGLLPGFHAAFAAGARPAAALRTVQVEALRSGQPASVWGGITLFAGE